MVRAECGHQESEGRVNRNEVIVILLAVALIVILILRGGKK